MANDQNSNERRLTRIETRLTNFGRHMGFDLKTPPPSNAVDQPVFIDEGVVYTTPATKVSDITQAVLRYQEWGKWDREVPVVVNGHTVMTIDPLDMQRAGGA